MFGFAVVGENAASIDFEQAFVVSISDGVADSFTGGFLVVAIGSIVEIKDISASLLRGFISKRIDSEGSVSGLPRIGNDLQFQRRKGRYGWSIGDACS